VVLIAHIADLHIGAIQYGLLEREQDFYDAWEEVISKILEEHAKLVIISGDTVDKPRLGGRPLRALYRGFKKLKDHNVEIIAILGEHDFKRVRGEEPILYLFADQGLLKIIGVGDRLILKRNINGLNILIAGLSKHRKSETKQLLHSLRRLEILTNQEDSNRKILMLHQGLKELNPHAGEITLDQLPRNFNYYAFGHYHTANSDLRINGAPVTYPGSLEVVRIDELNTVTFIAGFKCLTAEKGFYIVDFTTKEPLLHRIKIDIRPQLRIELPLITLKLRTMLVNIAKELRKLGSRKKPILHITFKDSKSSIKDLDTLLSMMIGPHVLTYRWSIEEETSREIEPHIKEEVFSLEDELLNLARAELKSDELAKLVLEILEITKSNIVEHAKIERLIKLINTKLLGEVE